MVINISVQYNGGFLPDIILLTLFDYIGEPFEYLVEFLSQSMFPPRYFDNFSRKGGCSERFFRYVQIFVQTVASLTAAQLDK